ncbi:hypothetical protein KPATCC21470_0402 [Kitasatospora purpeofusca]
MPPGLVRSDPVGSPTPVVEVEHGATCQDLDGPRVVPRLLQHTDRSGT